MDVIESYDGIELKPGLVIVASAEYQVRLVKKDGILKLSVIEEGYYKGNCPSIDILFSSVAEAVDSYSIGVILTGLGKDGTEGLLEMKSRGGTTIAQDEQSSVAYGMPRSAVESNAVSKQLSLSDIPNYINTIVNLKPKSLVI